MLSAEPIADLRLASASLVRARRRAEGFRDDQRPSPSTMAEVLNRNGYRLRKVLKANPQESGVDPAMQSST